ncbi:MAG: OadG family protein [Tannerella sp.]|nr:OadG family protein [Tannerella sp.]
MENLAYGLLLMLVGMVTVFIVLLIVIGLGKLLIHSVNKYAPEEIVKKAVRPAVAGKVDSGIADPVVVAIVSAVNTVTQGKGKVTSIRK